MSNDSNGSGSLGYKQELKRALKTRDLVIYGMILMSPMAVVQMFGILTTVSQGHVVIAYLVAFVAMLFTAFSYGRMVEAFPVSGSTYSFTQRSISPKLGFLAGWAILLDYVFVPMLLFVISANFANALFPTVPLWVWVLIYVAFTTIINYLGIELASLANLIIYAIMILAVIAFIVLAFRYSSTGAVDIITPEAVYNKDSFQFPLMMNASAIAVLTYLGFDGITTLTEEAKVPAKKIGRAIFLACLIQTVIYIAVSYFATTLTLDYTQIGNVETVFFDISYTVGGSWFQIFMTLVNMLSGASIALAAQIAASRVLFGMGRDKMIPPKFFAHVHTKFKTPTYNIFLMAAISVAGALTISLDVIGEIVTFGALFGFICVNLSVISHYWIRAKEKLVFRNLIFPAIGFVVCVYIWLSLSSIGKAVGFTWLAIGIVYLVVRYVSSDDFKARLDENAFKS
ncbi:MAG: APC family permease [Clostridiales bacterium]|nr:APC family permease [Clostridiales bacterium]